MPESRMKAAPAFVAALVLCAVAALAAPSSASAQCPLCRSALQQAGDQTARTMNLAILVLLIPPVSIFCTIFAVAYRRRSGDADDEDDRGLEP
jgi:heme/copper-type cytochrome/quinol oxidase subunit 2